MTLALWVLIIALGASVGSFLNVCADRLPEDESLLQPPSHCPACGRRLTAREMIPVLSYIALRGRCRTCGERIPLREPLVEALTAALFLIAWLRAGPSLRLIWLWLFIAFLIVIAVVDLEHRRILNSLSYPAIGLSLIAAPFGVKPVQWMLAGGALVFLVFFLLAALLPGGMGMGDVKLATFIGFATGYPQAVLAIFLAFLLGGLIAGGLWLAGVVKRRDPVPFGPFLAAAAIAALLYGDAMLAWWIARF